MSATTTTKLTLEDLERAQGDPLRMGTVGYSEGDSFREKAVGDRMAVREANRLGWTYPMLLAWVDSKYGRWYWDALHGCNDKDGARRLMTIEWMTPGERAEYGIQEVPA